MPSAAADNATGTGILYPTMVITSVNSNVSNPAMCPFILFTDRAQKRKRIGIETTEAVRPRLPPTAE